MPLRNPRESVPEIGGHLHSVLILSRILTPGCDSLAILHLLVCISLHEFAQKGKLSILSVGIQNAMQRAAFQTVVLWGLNTNILP